MLTTCTRRDSRPHSSLESPNQRAHPSMPNKPSWPRLHRIADEDLMHRIDLYSAWGEILECHLGYEPDHNITLILGDVDAWIDASIRIYRAALNRTGEYGGISEDIELLKSRKNGFVHKLGGAHAATITTNVCICARWICKVECTRCEDASCAEVCSAPALSKALMQIANETLRAVLNICGSGDMLIDDNKVIACVINDTKFTERFLPSQADLRHEVRVDEARIAALRESRVRLSTASTDTTRQIDDIDDTIRSAQYAVDARTREIERIDLHLKNIMNMQAESTGELREYTFDNVVVVCGGTPYMVIRGHELTLTIGSHSTTYDIASPGVCASHRRLHVVVRDSADRGRSASHSMSHAFSIPDSIESSQARWIAGDRDTMHVSGRFKYFGDCTALCDARFFRLNANNVEVSGRFVTRDSVLVQNSGEFICSLFHDNVKTLEGLRQLANYATVAKNEQYALLIGEMGRNPFEHMYEIAAAVLRGEPFVIPRSAPTSVRVLLKWF